MGHIQARHEHGGSGSGAVAASSLLFVVVRLDDGLLVRHTAVRQLQVVPVELLVQHFIGRGRFINNFQEFLEFGLVCQCRIDCLDLSCLIAPCDDSKVDKCLAETKLTAD